MHIPFQLRSLTSSCSLGGLLPLESFLGFIRFSDRIGSVTRGSHEVYSTWNPPVAPEASQSCGYDADGSLTTSMDKTTTLYDLFKLHESLEGQTWEYDCVGVDTYLTLAAMFT